MLHQLVNFGTPNRAQLNGGKIRYTDAPAFGEFTNLFDATFLVGLAPGECPQQLIVLAAIKANFRPPETKQRKKQRKSPECDS